MNLGMYRNGIEQANGTIAEKTYPITIHGSSTCGYSSRPMEMTVRGGKLKVQENTYDYTFVVTVDYQAVEDAYNMTLPLQGFGSHSYAYFGAEATRVAKIFAEEQGWTVFEELNHWPVLQFVCTKPLPQELSRKAAKKQDNYGWDAQGDKA